MRLVFIIFISLVIHASALAQLEGYDAQSNVNAFDPSNAQMFRSFDNRYKGIKGLPTIFEDYVTGNVYLKSGITHKNVKLNFDAFDGELLALSERSNNAMLVRRNIISHFEFYDENNLLKFIPVTIDGKQEFVHLMYEGKISLLCQMKKKIEKADYQGAYSKGRDYDEFVDAPLYYIYQNNLLSEFKRNKKSILSHFPEKSSQINSYIKKNPVNFRDDKQLIRLFQYIDSL